MLRLFYCRVDTDVPALIEHNAIGIGCRFVYLILGYCGLLETTHKRLTAHLVVDI